MNTSIYSQPNHDGQSPWVSPHEIRSRFSRAMSEMYRREVPAYGQLLEIVEQVNQATLAAHPDWRDWLASEARLSEERHGAIRLGTTDELAMMRRLFAVMGMFPVGYYDLSVAGIPVHSTAFRPIHREALAANPFRVFTSLLRLELIEDAELRARAESILCSREIFTAEAVALVEQFERDGGFTNADADRFVAAALETFRWHETALVDAETYQQLHDAHRLIADVVSFKGPHINHLTPRTLDIDACQQAMIDAGMPAKSVIEGPPRRQVPILLRQTSFQALTESILFVGAQQDHVSGQHTARFGEIEQRGIALTERGRSRYDAYLNQARQRSGNDADYAAALSTAFADFPDDWEELRREGLAFFEYGLTDDAAPVDDLEAGLASGAVSYRPLVYEDFLPISAAGIFQSNLGETRGAYSVHANQAAFEVALGKPVIDPFVWYERQQQASIERCLDKSSSS